MNRKEKLLVNEHVTEETKRCLSIIENIVLNPKSRSEAFENLEDVAKVAITAIVKGQPYIEYNQDLEKRIPK